MKSKEKIQELLKLADVEIDGTRPWDIQVHNEKLYDRVFSGGSLALGESYMDGWWDSMDLSETINKVLKAHLDEKVGRNFETLIYILRSKILNLQNQKRSREVIDEHYDLDNDLYMSFLDPYNQYTCGYFKNTDDLNTAQEQKLDLICKKLQLKKGDRVLDIGCGWGGFAKYAAEHYGCIVTGISISDEQIKYAKEFCKGLPVTILKKDYREVEGEFDKVTVIGMIEHVGHKNYKDIMKVIYNVLTDDGLFLLHTIGGNISSTTSDPWFDKYIFPNGMTPSIKQIGDTIEDFFVMEDWHNFGAYYDKTLLAWFENFDKNWDKLKDRYNDRFYRMWKYYLLSVAGGFRSRQSVQLWQIVLSKGGVKGGYTRIS